LASFSFTQTVHTDIYTLSLHDALPILRNCHETTSAAEAREKLAKGMQILVREGTVSKDLAALAELITTERAPFVALCTDDRNPRSEEYTSELQSRSDLVCRLLLEKKNK